MLSNKVIKLSAFIALHLIALGFFVFEFSASIWGELLMFPDKKHYKLWWNARGVAQFWRRWNTPVHTFFYKHVHSPLRKVVS